MTELDLSCDKYINELIHVETHYGYGWSYPENKTINVTNLEMAQIKSFDFRLNEFIYNDENKKIGGIGIIEDNDCSFNEMKLKFTVRYSGLYDFDKEFPECNLEILVNNIKKDNVFGWGKLKAKNCLTTSST